MKKYIRKFQESSINNLTDTSLVDKIYNYFYEHPFPRDHDGVHKFAESIGIEPDVMEEYIYAMLSVFICGGKAYDAQKTEKDFDDKETQMGWTVEAEHFRIDEQNKVIKYISDLFRKRISSDHLTERGDYYSFGKECKIFDELK